MSVYIGVNDIAKKVKTVYIGINNKARKVKSGYIGVSNKARKFFSSGSGVDPTKTEYTEAEINALAAYGEINLIPIDSKVTIGNTQDTNRTIHTYRVIGKDHQDLNIENYGSSGSVEEGTAPAIGTVDLWATGAICKRAFNTYSNTPNGQYNKSSTRVWLQAFYYNGFSDVTKTHMKTMVVEYYFNAYYDGSYTGKGNSNTNDKVKLLSAKEFNSKYFHWQNMPAREGNGYEYFPSVNYSNAGADGEKRYASETGTAGVYEQWYRSLYCYSGYEGNAPWYVKSSGDINGYVNGSTSYAIVPCFRLGA